MVAILPARAGDATDLSRLMCRAVRHNNAADYPPEIVERILARHTTAMVANMIASRRVFVARHAGRIVGTIALQDIVLRGLFVEVDRQGHGIALGLVRHIEALAREMGLAQLTLQSSLTAHGFYEKLSYRTQAFRFDAEGSTYRMVKRIVSVKSSTLHQNEA